MPALRTRIQYSPPWTLTRPWRPRGSTGTDEYCNPSLFVQAPLLGGLTVFWHRGWRTEACDTCQAEYGPWCAACIGCHRGAPCHPGIRQCLDYTGHLEPFGDCPRCGGQYCTECEDDPLDYCPKEEP